MSRTFLLPTLMCFSVFITTQCRLAPATSGSTFKTLSPISCSLTSQVREWTNPKNSAPHNERLFYQVAREDGVISGAQASEKLAQNVAQWKKTLESDACLKEKLRCRLALVTQKAKKLLQTFSYAPYAHTLKIREIGGEQRILVKGFGFEPLVDPRQPGGVHRRYANGYVWMFRTHTGDLHPGFILAKLEGKTPERLDHMIFESNGKYARPAALKETYAQILTFHDALIDMGFLRHRVRGYSEDVLPDLYIVDPQKITAFRNDVMLQQKAESIFGVERAKTMMDITHGLLLERSKPTIVPNSKGKFEITEEMLKAMKREMPFVSIQNGMVQCADHHRIMAAHDLGMAIEVGVLHGFTSFN